MAAPDVSSATCNHSEVAIDAAVDKQGVKWDSYLSTDLVYLLVGSYSALKKKNLVWYLLQIVTVTAHFSY